MGVLIILKLIDDPQMLIQSQNGLIPWNGEHDDQQLFQKLKSYFLAIDNDWVRPGGTHNPLCDV
ncbi:MAG: hypothetical protein RLZZ490_197 [Cyanobacteriota bacterium]